MEAWKLDVWELYANTDERNKNRQCGGVGEKKSEGTLDSIIVFIRLLSRSFFSIIGLFFFLFDQL